MRSQILWWLMYLGYLGLALGLIFLMYAQSANPSFVALTLFFLLALLVLWKPRYGIYLIIFFTLIGDGRLIPWYPFTKNFSSRESLLFIHDALILNPLEFAILLTYTSWLGRRLLRRDARFRTGPLFWPSLLFLAFVLFGLVYGLGRGGNVNVALWESRAMFYIPAMLILVSNLLNRREHLSHAIWAAVLALFVEGLYGTIVFFTRYGGSFGSIDRLTEHSGSIHMNTIFVLIAALWVFRDASLTKRIVIPILASPVLITYLASQRRAAFLTLGIALVMMLFFLFRERRKLFLVVAPLFLIAGIGYIALFWNVTSPLGLPVQAIKSVIAPQTASLADQQSNIYRDIENYNILFTLRQHPITGVGFGQKFYMPVTLPDISFFVWWEYITHNSIVWIWMKMGVFGFISMLFLVATAISTGIRATMRAPSGDYAAIGLTATLYLVMHFIFAYVDISWDIQSMIYVGTMMGVINSLEFILGQPVPLQPPRWPWQPPPEPVPGLRPENI